MTNRQWTLACHAAGKITRSNWALRTSSIPGPKEGEILVRATWLTVDPFMRGKLNVGAGLDVGDVMIGGAVGEVVATAHPSWSVGDLVDCPNFGWQEYAVVNPDLAGPARATRIDPADPHPQAALSWLGMPGLTAYFAMVEVARPLPGDTVVVSAAAGAVGQIAGQIAALAGARVVGIAGSDEKLAWCRENGFDDTVNYRSSEDLPADIAGVCPDGVNVFFDGTGGPVHDAVLSHLAVGARVAIVGKVAVADLPPSADIGLRSSARLIQTRATVQGFVVYDWWHRREEAVARLRSWHESGRLRFREDVAHGFEQVPEAFLRMMRGENAGKQLVAL